MFNQQMTWLEFAGMLTGLAGVWLTVRASVWCFPTGILCVSIYAYIFSPHCPVIRRRYPAVDLPTVANHRLDKLEDKEGNDHPDHQNAAQGMGHTLPGFSRGLVLSLFHAASLHQCLSTLAGRCADNTFTDRPVADRTKTTGELAPLDLRRHPVYSLVFLP